LASDDPTEVRVPESVRIPKGSTSAAFDLVIQNDVVVDGPQTATITASVPGWTSGSDNLVVLDDREDARFAPSIAAGDYHSAALDDTGTVWGWGTTDLLSWVTKARQTEMCRAEGLPSVTCFLSQEGEPHSGPHRRRKGLGLGDNSSGQLATALSGREARLFRCSMSRKGWPSRQDIAIPSRSGKMGPCGLGG